MSLREVFITEGQKDKFFREQAENDFRIALNNIPNAHIEVKMGDDDDPILLSNEIGYFAHYITENIDLMVIFTTESNHRPRGHCFGRDQGLDRTCVVLYYNEDSQRLIKRKLLAKRGALENQNEAMSNILQKRYTTFIHEYMHYLDALRMGPYTNKLPPDEDAPSDESKKKWSEYYNSPLELNAYIQSIASYIAKNVGDHSKNWPLEDSQQFYFRAIHFIEKNFWMAWKHFSPESKRKVQKRIMQLWLDLKGSG